MRLMPRMQTNASWVHCHETHISMNGSRSASCFAKSKCFQKAEMHLNVSNAMTHMHRECTRSVRTPSVSNAINRKSSAHAKTRWRLILSVPIAILARSVKQQRRTKPKSTIVLLRSPQRHYFGAIFPSGNSSPTISPFIPMLRRAKTQHWRKHELLSNMPTSKPRTPAVSETPASRQISRETIASCVIRASPIPSTLQLVNT